MDSHPAAAPVEQPIFTCSKCGRSAEGQPDDAGWCNRCRAQLIRRAGAWAWLPALGVAALYVLLLLWSGLLESTLLVFWLALGAAFAFVAYKVGRRVAFDMLRTRAAARRS